MILESTLQNILADAIDTGINVSGPGDLIFEDVSDVEVALMASVQNPAFGAAAAGVITLLGVTLSDLSAAGGTTVQFSGFDGAALKQWELTVGTGGTEIIITNNVIVATEQVDLTALTLTVPTGP